MSVNPKSILEKGILKAANGCPVINEGEQLQQVGIDLRINKIYLLQGSGELLKESKRFPEYLDLTEYGDQVLLHAGKCYSVDTMEYVEVPKDMYATVIHRSTCNRMGATVMGSIYDPGFRGIVNCNIRPSNDIRIEKGVRIAQIVFTKADAASVYNGQYQDGKNILQQEGEKK